MTKSTDFVFTRTTTDADTSDLVITFRLDKAREVSAIGLEPSDTRVGFLTGNETDRWPTNIATFNSVALADVYDGIDLQLYARGNHVEQVFRLRSGANAGAIRVRLDGADKLHIQKSGALVIHRGDHEVSLSRPVAYQDIDGHRRRVHVAYTIEENSYAFVLGEYDKSRELVIDPLLQSSYLGGLGSESINNITIHPATGAVYVAGGTTSMSFGIDNAWLVHSNAYIAHLSSDLTTMVFVQFMGGTGDEAVTDIAVHPAGPLAGRLIVMGQTNSTDWPATGFGTQGDESVFVHDFGTDLQRHALKWISGSFNDRPSALAIHPASPYDVYIAGDTSSADFPGTAGGMQPVKAGVLDGFVVLLGADVGTLKQATHLGGANGSEVDLVIALDPVQGFYVKGRTNAWDAWTGPLTLAVFAALWFGLRRRHGRRCFAGS